MAVRTAMADLIAKVRLMIADVNSPQQFQDQDIQDQLDASRDDMRYEPLLIAPSIVNNANTGNQADTIFADFYSRYGWWEADITLQANYGSAAWVVVTPVVSELLINQAHFQFETDVFNSGTAPGQLPPVFATGKTYDVYAASADLLEFWAATLAGSYDITVDGQTLRRSQLMLAKNTMAQFYRKRAKPKTIKMVRNDVNPALSSRKMRLMDESDTVMGG